MPGRERVVTELGGRGARAAPRLFRAPGRVNLIGEHTDYNDGFVLPVALDMYCEVRAAPRADGRLRALALDLGSAEASWEIDRIGAAEPRGDWSDYVAGVARELAKLGTGVPSLDLEIHSSVPMGAGLSSSAALEVSVALALSSWGGTAIPGEELAQICQRAEAEFVGLQCGIMDQFVSVLGRRGHALLVDCRSLERRQIPLPSGVEIVMADSGVKHELATSEYNVRRQECERAAEALGRSLRDISPEQWTRLEPRLEDPLRARARHIVHENQRVLDFVAAAEREDLATLGVLMAQSHQSLATDYAVSCPELDFLVETASATPGVVGARMTGGGFGGCTVNLVVPDAVESFERTVAEAYSERFGPPPTVYLCKSADGARELAPAPR